MAHDSEKLNKIYDKTDGLFGLGGTVIGVAIEGSIGKNNSSKK